MLKIYTSIIALLVTCLFITSTFAAGPITHAVLADKWMAAHEQYDEEQRRDFIIGTLFPDIRYLGVISRNKTHEKGVTVSRLLEKQSAFTKGKRLHAFVDIAREKLVVKWKIYQKIKHIPGQSHKALFLKLLEDEILFAKPEFQEERQKIQKYLSYIHPEERDFDIAESALRKWHSRQSMAFSSSPSDYLSTMSFIRKSLGGVSPKILGEWSKAIEKLAQDEGMQKYVDDLVKEIDKQYKKKSK